MKAVFMTNPRENSETILQLLTQKSKALIFLYFRKKLKNQVDKSLKLNKKEMDQIEFLLLSLIKSDVKKIDQMKVEFQNLDASAACKLQILSSLNDDKEKYIGKKTDTENTIRIVDNRIQNQIMSCRNPLEVEIEILYVHS